MPDRVKVLSIDGGGIRGMIPALALAELEKRAKRPAARLFDLIAGTSTGGILACALTKPGENGEPAWPAEKLVGLYQEKGPEIFSRTVFQKIRSGEGLRDEKYPSKGLEDALADYLGEAMLSDAVTRLMLTSYETERRYPFFFKSWRAQEDPSVDFPMRLAARATSAAPTYFEALRLETRTSAEYYSLVDGGVFANNPAMCAYAEVKREWPAAEVVLVSLGTGQLTRPLPWSKIKDWGIVEWARPALDVVFDGVSDATDYQLRQVLREDEYWRLQVSLTAGASDDMDNTHEANLRALKLKGEELIADHSHDLDAIVAALAA